MIIRRARLEDTPAIVRMACRFIAESSYRGEVIPNPTHQSQLVEHLIGAGALFVAETLNLELTGFIAYALLPAVLSGELTACEIAWWVEPEWREGLRSIGVRLFAAGEAWAQEMGAAAIQMVEPEGNTDVARLYARRGYRRLETVWHRRLRPAA